MIYMKKLLERYSLKEATNIACNRCPGDYFKGAPDTESRCRGYAGDGSVPCSCGNCWMKEVEDAAWKEEEGEKRA